MDSGLVSGRPLVVFDGDCRFCQRQIRRVRRLDWLHRLDTVAYDIAVLDHPEIARGELDEGIRLRLPDGRVLVGIDALRSMGLRLPLVALPSLLLWLPPVRALGAAAYGWVAARRHRFAAR